VNCSVCLDLLSGIRTCFACKQSGTDLVQCHVPTCARFYHAECIGRAAVGARRDSPGATRMVCPLHICATCASESSAKTLPKICKGQGFLDTRFVDQISNCNAKIDYTFLTADSN
jgi:hypothetical protein